MNLKEWIDVIKCNLGRGLFPYQTSFTLVLPLRRLILSPEQLADRLPLFRDHRRAREWLPDTIYISQYEDAGTRLVSTYQEDINAATTTLPGGAQVGENLAVWREQLVKAK